MGKTPRILKSGKHGEEFYRALWKDVLAGKPFRGTIVNKRKTGELYSAEQTITPIKDNEGNITHFVSVLKDITELLEKKDQEVKLHLAREVQQRFYRPAVSVPGFDIAGVAYPADETGGDYFDFIAMPDDSLGIAIGDVSGHGIGAALVMAATRAYMRAFATTGTDVAEILARVNRALTGDLDKGSFVTVLLCRLEPRRRTLTFASAGHDPGFVLTSSGDVDVTLEGTGPPLGLFTDSVFSSGSRLCLDSGQIVLLTTDGVTESMAPDETRFGLERAVEYVKAHRHESAKQIAEGLHRVSRSYAASQPLQDDITIVIIKVN